LIKSKKVGLNFLNINTFLIIYLIQGLIPIFKNVSFFLKVSFNQIFQHKGKFVLFHQKPFQNVTYFIEITIYKFLQLLNFSSAFKSLPLDI